MQKLDGIALALWAGCSCLVADVAAQIEIGLGAGATRLARTTLELPGAVGDDYRGASFSQFQAEASVLFRPRAQWGVGLLSTIGTFRGDVIGFEARDAVSQMLGVGPLIVYRPFPWLSLEASAGRTFNFEVDATSVSRSDFDPTLPRPNPREVSHNHLRTSAVVHAGIAYLRLGYYRSSAERRGGAPLRDAAGAPVGVPRAYWSGFDVGAGVRFGTAARRYGRPLGLDSLMVRLGGPLERRYPRWRLVVEGDLQHIGQALPRLDELPESVDLHSLGLAAGFRQNDSWTWRASLGLRWAEVYGWQRPRPRTLVQTTYSSTITREVVVAGGAERRLLPDLAVAVDVGPAFRVARRVELSEDAIDEPERPELSAPVPRAAVTLLANGALRYYVGPRVSLDGKASLTLTSPYGGDADERLAEPRRRRQRWGAIGIGASYAIVR